MSFINILLNIYFRAGLLIIIAFIIFITFLFAGNFDRKETITKWRNIKTGYTWMSKKDNSMNLVLPVALAIGVVSGLSVLVFKKGVFNFKTS